MLSTKDKQLHLYNTGTTNKSKMDGNVWSGGIMCGGPRCHIPGQRDWWDLGHRTPQILKYKDLAYKPSTL